MYGNSCSGCGSSGYGMNSSISNCSPISYGAMQGRGGYGSSSGQQPKFEYFPEGKAGDYSSMMPSVPSALEVALETVKPAGSSRMNYSSAYKGLYLNSFKNNNFPTEAFLSTDRPDSIVVEQETDIMPHIKEAFEKLVGTEFPEDMIKINVLDDEKFDKAHMSTGGNCSPGVKGFAINRNGFGISDIFVRKDNLDRMMLTIGHEIGHVMSQTLRDARDEEAKAFAFSLAWMKIIKEHNIAGIGSYIIPQPAKNGLHDVAFDYLFELIQQGKNAMELFKELAKGIVSITQRLEVIYR